MTSRTAGRVTWVDYGYDHDGFSIGFDDLVVVKVYGEETPEHRVLATLVTTALNACLVLNPTDPLAAAQGLEELVSALTDLVDAVDFEEMNEGIRLLMRVARAKGVTVLSRVTGKP